MFLYKTIQISVAILCHLKTRFFAIQKPDHLNVHILNVSGFWRVGFRFRTVFTVVIFSIFVGSLFIGRIVCIEGGKQAGRQMFLGTSKHHFVPENQASFNMEVIQIP